MFFLFVLSYFRVPDELGYHNYLNRYDSSNITRLISREKPSIVIFSDDISKFEFTSLAIKRFKDDMAFASADETASKTAQNTKFPSIECFKRGKRVSTFLGFSNAIAFERWCKEIHDNETGKHILFEYEDLRIVFEEHSTVLFGVNQLEPPKEYTNDIKFISVPSKVFSFYNISVQTGYYVYRGIDRQLIHVTNSYHSYVKTPLVDVELDDIKQRPYFCGYFVDLLDQNTSSHEISILHSLAAKYSDFFFGPISGPVSSFMSVFGNVELIRKPFLIVWKTSDISSNRWTMFGDDAHNIEKIQAFLNGIKDGTIDFNPISENQKQVDAFNEAIDITNKSKIYKTSNLGFYDSIKKEEKPSLVLFSKMNNITEIRYINLMENTQQLLPELQYFQFDLSYNDAPKGLPDVKEYPYIMLFNKDGEDPHLVELGESFEDYINGVIKLVGLPKPKVNYHEYQAKMESEVRKEYEKRTNNY